MTTLPIAFIGGLQSTEIIFIGLMIFILFGAQKIPAVMRSLGRAQGEFHKAKREFEAEVKSAETKKSDSGTATGAADLDKARTRAKELGIDVEGKDLDTLKREIADKVLEG